MDFKLTKKNIAPEKQIIKEILNEKFWKKFQKKKTC